MHGATMRFIVTDSLWLRRILKNEPGELMEYSDDRGIWLGSGHGQEIFLVAFPPVLAPGHPVSISKHALCLQMVDR